MIEREQLARIIYTHTRQQYRKVAGGPEPVTFEDAGGISRECCYRGADAILSFNLSDLVAIDAAYETLPQAGTATPPS